MTVYTQDEIVEINALSPKLFPFDPCHGAGRRKMDICLLWVPYPLMLVNRAVCGFPGVSSCMLPACHLTVRRHRKAVRAIYES